MNINIQLHYYQQMQKEYKNLYYMITKHNPFPTNCMPFSDKLKNSKSLKKLFEISRSISKFINKDVEQINHKRRVSQYQIIDFKKSAQDRHPSSNRIHHNYSHFISAQASKTLNPMQIPNQSEQKTQQKYETIQQKANSTIIPRRKDLYDNHIEKYMATKYDNDELIKQYLTNREMFIQQACEEIEKEIKQELPINKKSVDRKKNKKYRSHLPKIEQASSHMLQKSITRKHNGAYLQQMNQIKKVQQLQFKDRRRKQRAFRHKMNSLEVKLSQFKNPIEG